MEGEPDFGVPMDMPMPDFSGIGKTMRMLSWLPAIISCVVMTSMTFLALVIYNGLTQSDYYLTYGSFMMIVLISLLVGLVTGGLVKISANRKMKTQGFAF
jgi:hypothetical protein